MTLLAATGPISRSLKGTAELIANTAQFQVETGKSAADSLQDHCFWPHLPIADRASGEDQQFITAPLCVVHTDPGQAINLPYAATTSEIATGEVFVQFVLIPNHATYPQFRDRETDLRNRIGHICRQAQELAADRTTPQQWMTVHTFYITQPPSENDIATVQFKNAAGDPIKVHIFPAIAAWSAT